MSASPVAPTASKYSTKPEDVQAWEDYYEACEEYVDNNKPCMQPDRVFNYRTMDWES